MKNLWKKLRVLVGIIIAMGALPLYAMEIPSKNNKNQLCGIDKLIFNRWMIDQVTQELFGDRFCMDIKNKISYLEFDLISLFKFPIPSADQLIELVNSLKNKNNSLLECVFDFDTYKVYHKTYTKTEELSFYLECVGESKDSKSQIYLQKYPTISKESLKLNNIKIGEGQIRESYYILIHYANSDHSSFSLYCQIPHFYKAADNPIHIHDLDFYIVNPGKSPLDKTEKWKVYKKSDYEEREFQKLTPLKKSLFVEYKTTKHSTKNKNFFGKLFSHSAQPKEKEEVDDCRPEDFCLYFLRK